MRRTLYSNEVQAARERRQIPMRITSRVLFSELKNIRFRSEFRSLRAAATRVIRNLSTCKKIEEMVYSRPLKQIEGAVVAPSTPEPVRMRYG